MIMFDPAPLSKEYHRAQNQNLKSHAFHDLIIFSCMPNIEENSRNPINWYTLLIEPQNYTHRRQHFFRIQNPPDQISLQRHLS